jgi:hypothetical protein
MIDYNTQQLDALLAEARSLAPADKLAELEADIKAKEIFPNTLGRFLERFISIMETKEFEKYADRVEPVANGGVRKPDQSNPWSQAGWNATAQSRLVTKLGEVKAAAIANAAGCKLGSTRPNPAFN